MELPRLIRLNEKQEYQIDNTDQIVGGITNVSLPIQILVAGFSDRLKAEVLSRTGCGHLAPNAYLLCSENGTAFGMIRTVVLVRYNLCKS